MVHCLTCCVFNFLNVSFVFQSHTKYPKSIPLPHVLFDNSPQRLPLPSSEGQTPLYAAMAIHGNFKPMKLLLAAKANLEAHDKDGRDLSPNGKLCMWEKICG